MSDIKMTNSIRLSMEDSEHLPINSIVKPNSNNKVGVKDSQTTVLNSKKNYLDAPTINISKPTVEKTKQNQQIKRLRQEVVNLNELCTKQERKIADQNQEIESLRKELKSNNKRLESTLDKKNTSEKHYDLQLKEIEMLINQIDEINRKCNQLANDLTHERSKVDEKQKIIVHLKLEIDRLNSKDAKQLFTEPNSERRIMGSREKSVRSISRTQNKQSFLTLVQKIPLTRFDTPQIKQYSSTTVTTPTRRLSEHVTMMLRRMK